MVRCMLGLILLLYFICLLNIFARQNKMCSLCMGEIKTILFCDTNYILDIYNKYNVLTVQKIHCPVICHFSISIYLIKWHFTFKILKTINTSKLLFCLDNHESLSLHYYLMSQIEGQQCQNNSFINHNYQLVYLRSYS